MASASSAHAIRTETSAEGVLMGAIVAAGRVLHRRRHDAEKCHMRWYAWDACTATTSAPTRSRRPSTHDPAGVHRAARRRGPHRAPRRHARGLPQDAGPADRPARPLRDHRHAARGQLDQPRAEPAPQGDPDGEGAGRGRPRPLPVRRGRDARRRPRRPDRPAALRPAEVLLDLQLPDAHLGRRRRDRLAGRRRRDHQPGAAVPLLLRPLRPRDGARVQGGVVPPAAGLRDPPHALARHARRRRRWPRTPSTATGGRR